MANFNTIKNICKKLGENNKPTYVVMSIAAVKGICRPTFTMMDKKEKPETKKYTALREGLTEVIAIPVYWACGEMAAKFGKYVVSKGMDKKLAELEAKGEKYTPEVKEAMKNASIKKGQTGLMFIGVCTAALFVIPAVCSLVIKPIMNAIGLKAPDDGKKHNTNDKKLDITEGIKPEQNVNTVQAPQVQVPQPTKQPVKQIEKPQMQTLFNGTASGMKVGGL